MSLNYDNYDFSWYSRNWVDTPEFNKMTYIYFDHMVDENPYLKHHFDVISENKLGFGEKAFRYFWLLILSQLPPESRFLEIGVYKGSILALSQIIARELGKKIECFGVTPMTNAGDKYSSYPAENYLEEIMRTFDLCGASKEHLALIKGLSTDPLTCLQVGLYGQYDVIYIDGGHDYQTVMHDLRLADLALKDDGFLIMDDCSCFLTVNGFKGHEDVSRAARDYLDGYDRFKHLFLCGHNRVWRKLSSQGSVKDQAKASVD